MAGILLVAMNGTFIETEASEKQRDDYTFGEIEGILLSYLNDNGYNLEIGTPQFNEFVITQMNTDKDQELANLDEYHLICAYFAEYLHQLTLYETELIEQQDFSNSDQLNTLDAIEEENDEDLSEPFNMNAIDDFTLGEMKQEIEQEEQEIKVASQMNDNAISIMATNTINVTNARAYAKKHFSSYNPLYPKYSNDCTNFVSQILQAGGRRQISLLTTNTLTRDNKYWFIKRKPDNTYSRSASWTVVTDLYSHLVRTQGSYSSTSKSNIRTNAKNGDVIQFKKSGADRYSHAMWIYEKTSSDLKLAGHTNDYWNRSFNAITGYTTYRIIKM